MKYVNTKPTMKTIAAGNPNGTNIDIKGITPSKEINPIAAFVSSFIINY